MYNIEIKLLRLKEADISFVAEYIFSFTCQYYFMFIKVGSVQKLGHLTLFISLVNTQRSFMIHFAFTMFIHI